MKRREYTRLRNLKLSLENRIKKVISESLGGFVVSFIISYLLSAFFIVCNSVGYGWLGWIYAIYLSITIVLIIVTKSDREILNLKHWSSKYIVGWMLGSLLMLLAGIVGLTDTILTWAAMSLLLVKRLLKK